MKITALLILTFLLTQVGYCQSDLVYFEYNKQKFISVELSNMVTALNNSLNSWETELKKNGYKENSTENDIHIFMKGEMGSIFQATSKDSINGVVSINWYDFTNKKSIMEKTEATLKDNFRFLDESKTKFYLVSYLDINYIIGLKRNPDLGMETIFIKKEK